MEMLEKEYQYFLDNKEELIKKYEGRFVVIINEEIVGDFSSNSEALQEMSTKHKPGTYLIQEVSKDEEVYIQRFTSRVYV